MAGRSPAGDPFPPRWAELSPLGTDGQSSAGPMPRSGEATGWAGHTQHDWPQATDQKHCAKRLTNATTPRQPYPAKAILHNACCLHPKGAKRCRPQKELATDWLALRTMRRYVKAKRVAAAGECHKAPHTKRQPGDAWAWWYSAVPTD